MTLRDLLSYQPLRRRLPFEQGFLLHHNDQPPIPRSCSGLAIRIGDALSTPTSPLSPGPAVPVQYLVLGTHFRLQTPTHLHDSAMERAFKRKRKHFVTKHKGTPAGVDYTRHPESLSDQFKTYYETRKGNFFFLGQGVQPHYPPAPDAALRLSSRTEALQAPYIKVFRQQQLFSQAFFFKTLQGDRGHPIGSFKLCRRQGSWIMVLETYLPGEDKSCHS
ncbi:hypothetical protein FB45DRAFT_942240 [Roridomyces roridus]|uniref:Uncharacterized protein n=1 Tax=Roridomyces roridus TaxID=1738132 RepID=A0AAD7FBW2_9AGAR|nr:hypothetical protein FB45DRAFT_942240 [Roridomyces roridus]